MATAQDFYITFCNNMDDEIKITEVEYKVDDKWRTEHMLGIDGHQKLEPHQNIGGERNLQGVGGKSTQIRVTYRVHIGGDKWGSDQYAYSGEFVATDSDAETVYIS